MNKLVSRIAPTPSGHLHIGNAINFLLTWAYIKKSDGELILRIDDMDSTRVKDEYITDIFDTLEWLNIDYQKGPKNLEDFKSNYSQAMRFNHYKSKLDVLLAIGSAYHCECTRNTIKEQCSLGIYNGICREKEIEHNTNKTAARLHVPLNSKIVLDEEIDLASTMGDFVLWRKDDLPAYQLASLIDDLDMGVNLIVRGEDLKLSTAAQILLSRALGDNRFEKTRFIHHPLLLDPSGEKLSKSKGATSIKELKKRESSPIFIYKEVAKFLGKDSSDVNSIDDLVGLI